MIKKKITSLVVAVAMVFAMIPSIAFADGAGVVMNEAELKEAFTDGGEFTLGADIELEEGLVVPKDKSVKLDLAGYTLSYNPTTANTTAEITNNGTLTIEDSSVEGTGTISNFAYNPDGTEIPGYASNTITNYGTLTVNSGTVRNGTTGGAAAYAIDNNTNGVTATTTINGGKIIAVSNAIRIFANSGTYVNTLNIKGGEIEGSRAIWIQLPGDDKTVNPPVDVNINGGVLSSTDIDGYYMAIYSYSFGNSYEGVDVDITGGTFEGDIAVHGGSSNGGTGAESVDIYGGVFNEVYAYGNEEDINIFEGTFAVEPYADYVVEDADIIASGDKYIVCTHGADTDVPEVSATYEQNGVKGHRVCSRCGSLFLDEKIVTASELVIPKLVSEKVDTTTGKVEVKDDVVNAVVGEAVEKGAETVVIPTAEATAVEVTSESLNTVITAQKPLTITNKDVEVTFDVKALEAINKANTKGENVVLKVEPVKETELNKEQKVAADKLDAQLVIKAEVLLGDKKVANFNGGKVTVFIPFTAEEGASLGDYTVAYIKDDGTVEKVATKVVEGGLLVELEHFSEYVVAKTDTVDKQIVTQTTDNKTTTPKTGDESNMAVYMLAMLLALAVGARSVVRKSN